MKIKKKVYICDTYYIHIIKTLTLYLMVEASEVM